ncbi:protein NEGATIVE REGULATOR OF RESISTANCE-like [Brachypodium distachyon]|uniref:protein NEGATIVE REGULATOR OF RESISTANCE-like n=1 Tax=Brachypodium distachyon TaxID=15368 RepID=UPI000D0E32C4|nr:protein NEGATIVE REGULATOR OF RESISTANCE-like [Brachypodium distachyon]|eukprot:XP_024313148.1 protein NEGATIVE REGULATOR OF RESISTANCE-like [Brachypodium distachyon]
MEAAPTATAKGTAKPKPEPEPKRKRGDVAEEPSAAAIAEVSDAEVEEFYAILRRASAARRLHASSNFSLEDFAPQPQPQPVAGNGTARRGLDLNAEPEPEPEPEAPAAAAPTRTN